MRGCAHGTNPGNVPFNANIPESPDNLDLPGYLPFTIGSAVTGEGGGDPGGHDDDQRDDQRTAPSTGMIVAIQFDEA
eukprot:4680865-Pyramimonas_sp.AAC.1